MSGYIRYIYNKLLPFAPENPKLLAVYFTLCAASNFRFECPKQRFSCEQQQQSILEELHRLYNTKAHYIHRIAQLGRPNYIPYLYVTFIAKGHSCCVAIRKQKARAKNRRKFSTTTSLSVQQHVPKKPFVHAARIILLNAKRRFSFVDTYNGPASVRRERDSKRKI